MGNSKERSGSLLVALVCCGTLLVSAVAEAGDGTIVLNRTVQPRMATTPTMVPDPNPTTVNPNISPQVNRLTSNELTDNDIAGVSSGTGLSGRVLQNGTLTGPHGIDQSTAQGLPGMNSGHSGTGNSIANTVNRSVTQGLAPLRVLTGAP
ncbi:hypothetical protein [Pseudomonas citronellolis]|uniref:hypothetical protein n=1 Tax=Pseudomonas citronellolis TaxID=53408 RepID=UPI0023E38E06|nr:hypothetical protein [Pseudomonas citronellolis]MDF3932344.1 hypothetical protein [Pseudomonas citronellolis]